jgi:hypothetical protein
MNSVRFGQNVFLNVLSILKPLSFEGSFRIRKDKSAIRINGIVLTSLEEILGWCESLLLLWVCVEWTVQNFLLHKFLFDRSAPYWCLSNPPSFWKSVNVLMLPFHGYFLVVSAFWEVDRCLLLGLSWRSSCPSLYRLNHSNTQLRLKISSP